MKNDFIAPTAFSCTVLALVIMFFGVVSHSTNAPTVTPVSAVEAAEGTNPLYKAITVGNHSYIPLNIVGNSSQHFQTILEALQNFETSNPALHVTSFSVDSNTGYHASNDFILGIWLTHEPR